MMSTVFLLFCISIIGVFSQEVTVRRDEEWPPALLLDVLAGPSKLCRSRTDATDEMIKRFSDKDVYENPVLKCYMKCILIELKSMDEDGNLDATYAIEALEKLEKWQQKIMLTMGKKCLRMKFAKDIDLCEKAFLMYKCLKEADPVFCTTVDNIPWDTGVDYFVVDIIFVEISKRHPFGIEDDKIEKNIRCLKYDMPAIGCADAISFIRNTLCQPKDELNANNILKHPFIGPYVEMANATYVPYKSTVTKVPTTPYYDNVNFFKSQSGALSSGSFHNFTCSAPEDPISMRIIDGQLKRISDAAGARILKRSHNHYPIQCIRCPKTISCVSGQSIAKQKELVDTGLSFSINDTFQKNEKDNCKMK